MKSPPTTSCADMQRKDDTTSLGERTSHSNPCAAQRSVWLGRMRVDETFMDSAIAKIEKWAVLRESRYVLVSNVHMTMEANDDPTFAEIVHKADLVCTDGVPVVYVAKALGLENLDRVFGADIVENLFERAAKSGLKLGFYGGKPEVLTAAVKSLQKKYPGSVVSYMHSPPFRDLSAAERELERKEIKDSGVQLLFVGLGCPKQERWMFHNVGELNATMIGVGWAFELLAGVSQRAPLWARNVGLEWFFRLLEDPKRLWKRQLQTNPRFLILATRLIFEHRRRSRT